jgi:hypothetical protein
MKAIATILFVASTIIAGEHALGLNLGSANSYFKKNEINPEYSFAWSIQYKYFTTTNFSISASYFQSNWDYKYIICVDPGVGYRIFISNKIYSGIEAGLGFETYGENGEIPNFGINGFMKISINAIIFPWLSLGICDTPIYEFNSNRKIINQISLECLFFI